MNAPGARRARLGRIAIATFLVVVVLVQLTPFYVALTTALKPKTDLSSRLALPSGGINWENFTIAIQDGHILSSILNSVLVTVATTLIVCVTGALAAYPLARRNTRTNRLVLLGILSLMMVPPLSVLVPLYSLLNQMGGINTYWGVVLVLANMQLPLAIFLYANFIRGLPVSIEEAATVDGANLIQVLFRIVFPMLKPVTATVVILTSVATWNEYALSVYLLTDPDRRTIAPAISAFFSVQSSNLGAASAASLLAVLPILVVYLFLQKYFIKGMVAGAEK